MASTRLDQMRTFVRVAALGSFAGAARELGMSSSAVSKQIRELENAVGARLIHRTTRRVSLTGPGKVYLERIEPVLTEVADLESTVRGLHAEPRGTLRVTAPQDFGRLYLCGILGVFGASYPELRIELELTDRLVDVVEEGFDVALRIAKPRDSSLIVRKLGRCERVLCATPAYLERYGCPASPAELASHCCIEYSYLASSGWRFRRGKRSYTVVPTGRFRANSGWAMHAMVLADLGIALLPTFIVHEDLASGRLRPVLRDELDADLDAIALLPPGRQVTAKARAFVDFVAERLAGQPWWKPANEVGRPRRRR